jgi:hypothetical protein
VDVELEQAVAGDLPAVWSRGRSPPDDMGSKGRSCRRRRGLEGGRFSTGGDRTLVEVKIRAGGLLCWWALELQGEPVRREDRARPRREAEPVRTAVGGRLGPTGTREQLHKGMRFGELLGGGAWGRGGLPEMGTEG